MKNGFRIVNKSIPLTYVLESSHDYVLPSWQITEEKRDYYVQTNSRCR